MDIWLDTTATPLIQYAFKLGILSGVTTNPSIIANSNKSPEEIIESLLHYQEGPITVQVVAEDVMDMVQQGQNLHAISNRIIIKVPATKNGLEAIRLLSRQGISTMATVIFTARQALMASLVGADYVALYINRIEQSGNDPWIILSSIIQMYDNYKIKTKILGASICSVEQVTKCAELGIYGVTLKDGIFQQLIADHPLTTECVSNFNEDWKKSTALSLVL